MSSIKKTILFLFLLLNIGLTFGQDNPLQEYANEEGIATMFITKKMISDIPIDSLLVGLGSLYMSDFFEKIDSINVYSSSDKNNAKKLLSFANNLMQAPNYEKLTANETDRGGVISSSIYSYIKRKENQILEYIIVTKVGEAYGSVMQFFVSGFTMEHVKSMEQHKQ